jgi:hypothetical protein
VVRRRRREREQEKGREEKRREKGGRKEVKIPVCVCPVIDSIIVFTNCNIQSK